MTGPAVRVQDVSKSYGRIQALAEISLSLFPHLITAFLGENGAGKTTFLKVILGFLRPDRGRVSLNAEPVGYVPEHPAFFPRLRGIDILSLTAHVFGVSEPTWKRRMENISRALGFDQHLLKREIRTYSPGHQKKLSYLQSLIISPELLIVDEPFSSLDPLAIKGARDLFAELRRQKKTVVLSSHLLAELEKICDEFIIIRKGKVLCQFEKNDVRPMDLERAYLFFHQTDPPYDLKRFLSLR